MSFPFVKQHDSMQCGISCVCMICQFYGKKLSLRFLENYCQPSKDGVSLKGIADLCDVLKIEYTAGRVSLSELSECPKPCILHWNQNHFVVLYKIDKSNTRFWIADPAKGKYRLTLEEFSNHWLSTISNNTSKGIAMFLQKTETFDNLTFEDYERKRSFRFLWKYITIQEFISSDNIRTLIRMRTAINNAFFNTMDR